MNPTRIFGEMRLVLLVVLATTVAGSCQATAGQKAALVSPFAAYAGEWTSAFDGNVWLRLRLDLNSEKLSGSMVHAKDIMLNDDGGLKSVGEEQSTESVSEAVVNPDGLLLTLKDPETQETYRYQMKLVAPANESAELRMIAVDMPPGMAKPKPWKLAKAVPR